MAADLDLTRGRDGLTESGVQLAVIPFTTDFPGNDVTALNVKNLTRAAQRKLNYVSARDEKRLVPVWVDETIRKAVHPDPYQRYGELSEFVYDLHHPNPSFLRKTRPPLLERNPVVFWKLVSLFLAVALIVVLSRHPAVT